MANGEDSKFFGQFIGWLVALMAIVVIVSAIAIISR